jgi:hypothetical protein
VKTAVAVLVLTSALLGACGSEPATPQQETGPALTHEQYQQAILGILESEDMRTASRLFTDTVATEYGREQCSQKVRAFHASIQSIVQRVDDLQPPADAVDGQREFLDGAQESVRLVGVAADDVAKGDLRCGMQLNRRIYGLPSTARAEAGITKLEKSGYFVRGE